MSGRWLQGLVGVLARVSAFVLVLALTLAASGGALAREDAAEPGKARSAAAATIAPAMLPPEVQATLVLIKQGGPFPYRKDGAVFGNRERRLPKKERGYYREYTVRTPGSHDRGARRIVAGAGGEFYYTDDHYDSFRLIVE